MVDMPKMRLLLIIIFTMKFRTATKLIFNGYGNKQNCRIWSQKNLDIVSIPNCHVLCALCAGGIICSYLFKIDTGQNLTAMIIDFFVPN